MSNRFGKHEFGVSDWSLSPPYTQYRNWQGQVYDAQPTFPSVSDTDYSNVLIRTGEAVELLYNIDSGGKIEFSLYRNPNIDSVGTLVEVTPTNDNVADQEILLETQVHTGTTVVNSEYGEALVDNAIRGGTSGPGNQNRTPSAVSRGTARILRPDTDYLLRTQNISGGETHQSFFLEFVRQTPRF